MSERVRRTREPEPREEMPRQSNGRDKIRLELTPDQLSEIDLALESSRKVVKVDREALRVLLSDHFKLVVKFRGELGGYL